MNCPNCQHLGIEEHNYCPNCGQSKKSKINSLGYILRDFLDAILNVDTKFLETLKAIIIAPGKITYDYLNDKRARYVSPGRLYVVSSIILFAVIGFTTKNAIKSTSSEDALVSFSPKDSSEVNIVGFNNLSLDDLERIKTYENAELDSFLLANDMENAAFNKLFIKQAASVITTPASILWPQYLRSISISMFFLMPVFGLILALVYVRQRRYYVAHLIYSVHFHALTFLLLALVFGLLYMNIPDWGIIACVFGPFIYLLLTLKRVYRNGWIKTIFKFGFILFVYSFILSFSMLITAFIALLLF